MKTIKELLEQNITDEIDTITVKVGGKPSKSFQYDSIESAIADKGEMKVKDYEIEYDADEGMVYLDIYV